MGEVLTYTLAAGGLGLLSIVLLLVAIRKRSKGVDLYIDRNDPYRYWFDLPF